MNTPVINTPLNRVQVIGILLAIASYCLLWPGVTEPIMTLSASIDLGFFKTELFHETRSIWETVETLHKRGDTLVAFLIVTFSVIIPVTKGLITLFTALKPSPWRWRMVAMISKWSMVDVFVVAILVAFMTAKATAELQAELLPGFWWFLSFCLLSVLSGQLLAWNQDRR